MKSFEQMIWKLWSISLQKYSYDAFIRLITSHVLTKFETIVYRNLVGRI